MSLIYFSKDRARSDTGPTDATPNAFSFTNLTSKNPSSAFQSEKITVTGLSPNRDIEVSCNGGGSFDAATSTVNGLFTINPRIVRTSPSGTLQLWLFLSASSSFNTTKSMNVFFNGVVVTTWTITTRAPDLTGSVTFANTTNANLGTLYNSSATWVTGLEPNYTVSVGPSGPGGPNYQIDAGTSALSGGFYGGSMSVTTNSSGNFLVALGGKSSNYANETISISITLSGGYIVGSYSITTKTTIDSTPDSFTIPSKTGVNLNTWINSNQVTVTGLEPNAYVTISSSAGGSVTGIASGTPNSLSSLPTPVLTSSSGTMNIIARVRSSTNLNTTTSVNVNIGTFTTTFSTTTKAS